MLGKIPIYQPTLDLGFVVRPGYWAASKFIEIAKLIKKENLLIHQGRSLNIYHTRQLKSVENEQTIKHMYIEIGNKLEI